MLRRTLGLVLLVCGIGSAAGTADLIAHRNAVMRQIGDKGMLILYAAEPRIYDNDIDWPYHQEADFFYLTGLDEAGCTLALVPGSPGHAVIFVPNSNPAREAWTGHILTHPEVRRISGIDDVRDAADRDAFLATLLPRASGVLIGEYQAHARAVAARAEFPAPEALYMILPPHPDSVEYHREQDFAGTLAAIGPGVAIKDAGPIFDRLRSVKSPHEIGLLRRAVAITAEGFQRAFADAAPEVAEYEIQAQFEFTFLRRGGHWGYPSIVGSGVNATTLHYETNRARMHAGDLLLMDAAAEFAGYSADITRTIPVSGRYSDPQAEIYRLVWEAQQAAIRAARPGRSVNRGADSMQAAANQVFGQGLYRLGLVTDPASEWQIKVWFNHGIGHSIGLDVHDPTPGELQPGVVVTAEPGVYFRPNALDVLPKDEESRKFAAAVRPAFDRYKGIGVRIEDDVLITAGEPEVISSAIPSKLEDVEAAIARLRAEWKARPPE